jgi:hypothetical protein
MSSSGVFGKLPEQQPDVFSAAANDPRHLDLSLTGIESGHDGGSLGGLRPLARGHGQLEPSHRITLNHGFKDATDVGQKGRHLSGVDRQVTGLLRQLTSRVASAKIIGTDSTKPRQAWTASAGLRGDITPDRGVAVPTVPREPNPAYDPRQLPHSLGDLIIVDEASGCWQWTGRCTPQGYGYPWVEGRYQYSHRLSYLHFVGPLVKGMHVDHLCRVRNCANPEHLEQVTPRENVLRSPIHPMAIQARQTHCKRGHEFTPDNTQVRSNPTGRACKTCRREAARRRRERPGKRPQAAWVEGRTHCINGHELTSETIHTRPNGSKICRICRRISVSRYNERVRGVQS